MAFCLAPQAVLYEECASDGVLLTVTSQVVLYEECASDGVLLTVTSQVVLYEECASDGVLLSAWRLRRSCIQNVQVMGCC